MMVDFRPVDCESGSPLPFLPGHVSSSLYDEAPGTGWAWYRYVQ